MALRTNIIKRRIRQKNREGRVFEYDRYVLHYRDPSTGKRRMVRYDTRKEAEAAQAELIKGVDQLTRLKGSKLPTLKEAVEYWLKSRKGTVQDHTYDCYCQVSRDYLIGPVLRGTCRARRQYGLGGRRKSAEDALVPMLGGDTKIEEITTAQIREWYLRVREVTTPYVARCAKKTLSSIFRLIEEDFDIRLARMPTRVGPAYRRQPRQLLNEEQARRVMEEAKKDKKWGVYYAFPFLTGTRPNEQLGLLWEDVDLERSLIQIRRTQKNDGTLKPFTKTEAGMREIPINSVLLDMLREWRECCPRTDGKLDRVFPGQGWVTADGDIVHAGSPLSLSNYRIRVWYPMLKRLGLPQVAPYAARHMVISHLQSQGIEVGLVAKIAGHANPQITLQYYTHAVRQHQGVMNELNNAYGI